MNQHKIVYYDENSWAATPADNGPIWQWGDDLLVSLTSATLGCFNAQMGNALRSISGVARTVRKPTSRPRIFETGVDGS